MSKTFEQLSSYLNANPKESLANVICNIEDLIHDSSKQQEIFDNPGHPHTWMMDFVYDSDLRKELIQWTPVMHEEFSPFNPS